jgi:hypothetical protein
MDSFAQRVFTEEDHTLQAGFLDAADESLGVRIGSSRQLHPMVTVGGNIFR